MREFRIKQKKLYKIMKAFVIVGAVFIFLYIGAQPYVAKASNTAAIICNYACDLLIIANLCLIFSYYSKYGKSDSFLETIEYELDDYGYYLTARQESSNADFIKAMQTDCIKSGFAVDSNIEADGFDFAFTAFKKNEFIYTADIDSLSRSDIVAYIDAVINDLTVQRLKRKGNCVICFVTDKAQEDAIAISKMITPLGKKEQLKIALAIAEPSTQKCYFLGNKPTKYQQMIANYVLRCDIPIDEKYKGERRLDFQDRLEKHMESFDIKKFKSGTFYAH